jgi:hypothetical protein
VHRVLGLTQLPRNANYIFEPFNIGGVGIFFKLFLFFGSEQRALFSEPLPPRKTVAFLQASELQRIFACKSCHVFNSFKRVLNARSAVAGTTPLPSSRSSSVRLSQVTHNSA